MEKIQLHPHENITWLDFHDPSESELLEIAEQYQLHWTSVQDCLLPTHLPKHEKIGETTFLILRAMDEDAPGEAENLHQMTRKIAIFYRKNFLITIHRGQHSFLENLKLKAKAQDFEEINNSVENVSKYMAFILVRESIESFRATLHQHEMDIELFEDQLFGSKNIEEILREIHWLKRRLGTIRRIMLHNTNLLAKITAPQDILAPHIQDVKEMAEHNYFITDELLEDVTNLLNIHLSIASHKTNEVIRFLTIFSVFFLPLTFIVGVYGMNFEFMPELQWRYGYAFIWLMMVGITAFIYYYLRKKGWIKFV